MKWALPAWLDLQSAGFFIAGALMCAPLTYCAGKRDAEIVAVERMKAAAAQVQRAAMKAELAANAADYGRRTKSAAEIADLKEIVDDVATHDAVGDGMQALLTQLRERRQSSVEVAPD